MTLYELTAEFQQLLEMAENEEVDGQAIQDTLEAVGMEIEDKADGYARVIRQLEADAAGAKAEIERLAGRKATIDANIRRLKVSLETAMRATGKTKFKTTLFAFNIQKNPASVDIPDESAVPPEFRIPQPDKIDRRAVVAYLKEIGEQSWATLKQTESLRIR